MNKEKISILITNFNKEKFEVLVFILFKPKL